MKLKASLPLFAFLLLLAPALAPKAQAQGGRHPHYIQALAHLRLARGYLYRLTPSEHIDELQDKAVHELEMAISQIKAAAIDDGKDINDHPPIDPHIAPHDRFERAHQALDAAQHDVQQAESDPDTRDLRNKISDHISRTISYIRDIEAHHR